MSKSIPKTKHREEWDQCYDTWGPNETLWYNPRTDRLGIMKRGQLNILAGQGIDVICETRPTRSSEVPHFIFIGEFS